ncbi:ABC-2 type transport system permease protein [Hydrogenoanaerobacterium saccharovorans]|uniref:Transport permease protein n=1 Tax=Hydrogenoanaerobacterium saccharovorans TaxID=474960 RepID=A0A1H8EFH5_9FIRM|nr:ABC transporter permease [Hydrogenoanaerobacterium saccharovorans]RPF42139.1 ABC-2 type transport system permease protein [Hydrogenoanaerobacterium saccharovorans]SEN18130.1 ABC-2 type transport system permease protein [Hydrogenoanaerobacterium saccharovorans]
MVKRIEENIKVFLKYSTLLKELVIRDIKVRYRKSVLGLLWTVLNPLLMMVVITIVFSTIFKQNIPNFPIYYLSGSLIFSFNSESTSNAMYAIIGNASLIKKVYIPKYLFPLSKTVSGLVNLGFSFIAMVFVMIITNAPFYPTLLLLPIPIVYTFIFSTGLGLFLGAFAVYFRDICHFYGVFILAWTYLTPIFYPVEILPPTVLTLMKLNPMYHYVGYFRDLILYGIVPGMRTNFYCIVISLITFIVGVIVFYKKQDNFVLYI